MVMRLGLSFSRSSCSSQTRIHGATLNNITSFHDTVCADRNKCTVSLLCQSIEGKAWFAINDQSRAVRDQHFACYKDISQFLINSLFPLKTQIITVM